MRVGAGGTAVPMEPEVEGLVPPSGMLGSLGAVLVLEVVDVPIRLD
jgi:hypothetical protein